MIKEHIWELLLALIPVFAGFSISLVSSKIQQSNEGRIKWMNEQFIKFQESFIEVCLIINNIFILTRNNNNSIPLQNNIFKKNLRKLELFQKQSLIIKCFLNAKQKSSLEQFCELVSQFISSTSILALMNDYIKPEKKDEFLKLVVEKDIILNNKMKYRIKFEQKKLQLENILKEKLKPSFI